jgi:hypothetical protein
MHRDRGYEHYACKEADQSQDTKRLFHFFSFAMVRRIVYQEVAFAREGNSP